MKLKTLIKEIPELQVIKGSKEIDITGISSNSKTISPGNIFVAKRGASFDGNAFVPEAIRCGASAILSDMFDPTLKDVTQLIHPNVPYMEARLAHSYFERPSDSLFMIGITGTCGKTTTSYLLRHALESLGKKTALIGTIEYIIGDTKYEGVRTTPDLPTNIKFLREAINAKCTACVMETTSHALSQGRVEGIDYDVGLFLNLSHEHLDYHKTMESYFESKKLLFTTMEKSKKVNKFAILNADSPWTPRILESLTTLKTYTFGIKNRADIYACDISLTREGVRCTIEFQNQKEPFFFPLFGKYNVENCLAAVAALCTQGISLKTLAPVFKTFTAAPGRLEKVVNAQNLSIYVDYAHKVEAMQNVLQTMREVLPQNGKLITVFGCGGDRDREKRPMMGASAEEYSDVVIITSDNPRSEDPQAISDEIIRGCKSPSTLYVELDRTRAIEHAIEIASENDIVLILGKGHETKQIFNGRVIDFDDRIVAKELCKKLVYR